MTLFPFFPEFNRKKDFVTNKTIYIKMIQMHTNDLILQKIREEEEEEIKVKKNYRRTRRKRLRKKMKREGPHLRTRELPPCACWSSQ